MTSTGSTRRDRVRRRVLGSLTLGSALLFISPAQAAIVIDPAAAVLEDGAGAALSFTVRNTDLVPPCGGSATVQTVSGTATSGVDFTPTTQTVNFSLLLGCSATVTVPILADALDEPDETVTLELVGTPTTNASGTITDDDAAPSASIGAGSRAEGTGSAAGYVGLPVALSAPSGREITVPYTVQPGTATAPQDIKADPETLTIPAGQTGGEIRVATVADDLDEPDETFTVTIAAPTNASLGNATATGTVVNDDTPVVRIDGVALGEGTSSAPTSFRFPVTLSNPSTRTITVRARTADAQATAPGDYVAVDTTVTFAPGDTGQLVTVAVAADALKESNEAFSVGLSEPVGATLGAATAIGVIIDDDSGSTTATVPGGTVTPKGTGTSQPLPTGGESSDHIAPRVGLRGLTAVRLRTLRVLVTCPASESRCAGTLTVFSVPKRGSKVKRLRRETRMGRKSFVLAGGQTVTLKMNTTAAGQTLLRAVRRLRVRAFGVARDAAGNIGTGTITTVLKR